MNRKFSALTELDGLTDAQARSLVLGNWHKLNRVLRADPPVEAIRWLLVLELTRSPRPRPNVARRLRSALSGATGREARDALERVLTAKKAKKVPELEDMYSIGMTNRYIKSYEGLWA